MQDLPNIRGFQRVGIGARESLVGGEDAQPSPGTTPKNDTSHHLDPLAQAALPDVSAEPSPNFESAKVEIPSQQGWEPTAAAGRFFAWTWRQVASAEPSPSAIEGRH